MLKLSQINKLTELVELRELYRIAWPTHSLGYYALDNFVKWHEKEPQLRFVQIYRLCENWRQSGLYLIMDRFQLFVNSLKPNDGDLGVALKLLDWTRGYKITSIPHMQFEIVIGALHEMRINWRGVKLRRYHMPTTQALQCEVNCPVGFELRSLRASDAEEVNDCWPSRQAGSLQFIRRLIQHNISVGVYQRGSDQLVAWCTRCQYGFLGTLHVKDNFRRLGLATLVINAFARKVAASGEDVYVIIYEGNEPSNALFTKIGFVAVDSVHHMKAFCVRAGLEWPANED